MLTRLIQAILGAHDPDETGRQLRAQGVPVAEDPCRACANPCDQGHLEMPKLFLDTSTNFFGSMKPIRRHVLISTGTSDWPRKIENESGTLAYYLNSADSWLSNWTPLSTGDAKTTGVFTDRDSARLAILNASHSTVADDTDTQTVLVFPDFKAVVGTKSTAMSAEELWRYALDPAVGREGNVSSRGSELRSYILPYAAVVMICSHKRRDNRCGLTAPLLIDSLNHELTLAGWEMHQDLEFDHYSHASNALELAEGTAIDHTMTTQLHQAGESKRVLVLGVSHVGGHKWAGLMQIYTAQGTGVFYGRVTPHEIPAIVQSTILQGKVLPGISRGVMNASRPAGQTLLDW